MGREWFPAATRQRNGLKPQRSRLVGRVYDIWRLATGADRNQEISGVTQRFNLPRENFFVTKVVAQSGEC